MLCEMLVAIDFGHEIDIFIPKSIKGGGGPPALGNFPKKNIFLVLPLLGFQFVEQAVATPYEGV